MARVSTVAQQVRLMTGGVDRFEIAATSLRALLQALDRRYPGLAEEIDRHMAVAVDGELVNNLLDTPLAPDSEVVLIPRISGG